jgi:hypothetical protein
LVFDADLNLTNKIRFLYLQGLGKLGLGNKDWEIEKYCSRKGVYLRGNLNNCEFPLTGYAPMDVESWRRIFRISKAHGLNHMRFHSWRPPEAAFIAADEYGFYLQPEGPSWANHGTTLGDGRFIDQYIYDETTRMEKAYGNYASYCMLSAGNEPAGKNQAKYLGEFVKYWQAKVNRRVYTGASVAMCWPLYPESDYMIKSGPRGLNWNNTSPETQTDYHTAIENFKVPYVTHEMGQWCVFPNFKEIKKYTGVTRFCRGTKNRLKNQIGSPQPLTVGCLANLFVYYTYNSAEKRFVGLDAMKERPILLLHYPLCFHRWNGMCLYSSLRVLI